jgi:hypothetical protein
MLYSQSTYLLGPADRLWPLDFSLMTALTLSLSFPIFFPPLSSLSSLSQASQRDGRLLLVGTPSLKDACRRSYVAPRPLVYQQPEGPSPKWTMGWKSTSYFWC